MNDTSAKEIWQKLEEKYLTKTIHNQNYLLRKFYRIDMRKGISMSEHLNDFTKIIADLVNLGVDVSDETKAVCLLNSLPDEYEQLATTLTYGKDKLVYGEISAALLNHASMRKDKEEWKSSTPEVLMTRGRPKEKKGYGGRGKPRSKSRGKFLAKDECSYCHEKGHWKKDCPKAKQKDKGKDTEANVAHSVDNDSDYSLSVSSMVCSVSIATEWILDCGATYHCCPLKEWFSNLKEQESGVVVMGNDQPCHIMGIGSIRLRMFVGMIRELKDVRYVPGLKKNLISLGSLEAKGYKLIAQDGILKVVSGAMVLLKGTRRKNLYFLQGNTITGDVSISDAEAKKARETTRIWHMRLAHSGEKSLQTLIKQGLLKGAIACKLEFYEHCVLGKQTRVRFGTAIHNTSRALDYVHTDVWGPTKTASWGGKHWFVSFVDDFSR